MSTTIELIQDCFDKGLELKDTKIENILSLNGASSNPHFKVITQNDSYFVKVFEHQMFSANEREKQFQLQLKLFEQGVAVEPIFLSKNAEVWIEHWHDDKPNTKQRSESITRAAEELARIHTLPIAKPEYDYVKAWSKYLTNINGDSELYAAQAIHRSVLDVETDRCFCHHDLSFGHISAGHSPIFFDWEYAGWGCRWFDVVSCIMINELNTDELQKFMETYCVCANYPLTEGFLGVERLRPVVEYTNQLWQCAFEQMQ